MQPWEKFPSDTHNGIFTLFYRTKTPNKWKMNCLIKQSVFQKEGHSLYPRELQKVIKRPSEARLKECRSCIHWSLPANLPLNHHYKIPHQIPLGWDTVFEGSILLCPPMPGKAIKLFFYTSPKTSISEIWLGTSAQRLRVWHENYSDCCFHSSVHYGNYDLLAFVAEYHHLAPVTQGL